MGSSHSGSPLRAAVAFLDVTDAIAAHNPDLTPEERRRTARMLIAQTAGRVRAGEYVIDNHPDKLSHATHEDDGFAMLLRVASKGTVFPGDSGEGLWKTNEAAPGVRTRGRFYGWKSNASWYRERREMQGHDAG